MVGEVTPMEKEKAVSFHIDQGQVYMTAEEKKVAFVICCGGRPRKLTAETYLSDCVLSDFSVQEQSEKQGLTVRKVYEQETTGSTCVVLEHFYPEKDSVRWEIALESQGGAWTTSVNTRVCYENTQSALFWAPWADARGDMENYSIYAPKEESDREPVVNPGWSPDILQWEDPLESQPFTDRSFAYGASVYTEEDPSFEYLPFYKDVISIPLATILEKEAGFGTSIAFSLEDTWLDATLDTQQDGSITLSRIHHRLGEGSRRCFALDIIPHEDDWRGGLRWMTQRYPAFFDPAEPFAHEVTGCGAYSVHDVEFDSEKMKHMAFGVNWKASFDFPYMGMFIPPVPDDQEWIDFKNERNSIRQMKEYSEKMQAVGFHVLNYFNVTEFGTNVQYPYPPRHGEKTKETGELWENSSAYLNQKLSDAVLLAPPELIEYHGRGKQPPAGQPYYTWEDGIVMDPGEPSYQTYLLEQARLHIEKFPASSGICIDRLDWLRFYSNRRDDGISMLGSKKVQSLYRSWSDLMDKLEKIFHEAGKVIYCNNLTKRIDILRYIDGVFDEFTYAGTSLNATSFLCLKKPFLGWVSNRRQILAEPDRFFQRYLYLGAHPMAPFPGNDHSLAPDPQVETFFLDYGPMLEAIKGRRWVLSPHAAAVSDKNARVNAFETVEGYAIPVVFGGEHSRIRLTLHLENFQAADHEFSCLLPGGEKVENIPYEENKPEVSVSLPLQRGCGMLLIRKKKQ